MVNDAEMNASEDKEVREKAEIRNEADTLVYSTEKSLSEYGEKISTEERTKIEESLNEVKKALQSEDSEDLKNKTELLKQSSYKLAEEMYKNAEAEKATDQDNETDNSAEQSKAGSSESSGKVEDVDYEVVDEEEKK